MMPLVQQAKACALCSLRRHASQVVVSNDVWDARIVIVGEAPGPVEDRRGEPFVGPSGQYLRQALQSHEIGPAHITNTCLCYPPGCRTPTRYEILCCKRWLHWQIDMIKPDVIVAVGGTALRGLCGKGGIVRLRGKILESEDVRGRAYRVFPILHPAAALRREEWKELFERDIARLGDL
ncbi:uracil-DNA glycosylase [Candidatus Uhrbacteria bacterium]|nr:uracil-DNA glycosylase [Candidatus Uhrbacteria bacterium]